MRETWKRERGNEEKMKGGFFFVSGSVGKGMRKGREGEEKGKIL